MQHAKENIRDSHYCMDLCGIDLRVTWVCVYDLTWHQNDLKVD